METLRGIGLMIVAMAAFATGDVLIKIGSRSLGAIEILFYSSLFGALIFGALTLAARRPVLSPMIRHKRVLQRNVLEVIGATCMIFAISNAPISLVTSISQAMPLVVTAGAALFLGEKVGPRRWAAIAVGFAGVLIILRPGAAPVSLGAGLAIVATFALAGRDLTTRFLPPGATTIQLGTWGFAVMVPAAVILAPLTGGIGLPDTRELLILLAMTAAVMIAYAAVTMAMRFGEVSAITPFRYTRLLFAMSFATLLLGERPDRWTYVGAAVVISSGLYILYRQRRDRARSA